MPEKKEKSSAHFVLSTAEVGCLIVVPSEMLTPDALLTGLSQRNVSVREVVHTPTAIAELVLGNFNPVIIVEPDRVTDSEEFVTTVNTYFPKIRVWQYTDGQLKPYERRTRFVAKAAADSTRSFQSCDPDSQPGRSIHSIVTLSAEELAILRNPDHPEGPSTR